MKKFFNGKASLDSDRKAKEILKKNLKKEKFTMITLELPDDIMLKLMIFIRNVTTFHYS